MKKQFITVISFVFATLLSANAQSVRVGVRGDFNLSYLSFSDFSAVKEGKVLKGEINATIIPSFHLGIFFETPLRDFSDDLYFESGIAFTRQGAQLKSISLKEYSASGKVLSKETQLLEDRYLYLEQWSAPFWLKYDLNGVRPKIGVNIGFFTQINTIEKDEKIAEKANKNFIVLLAIGTEYYLGESFFFDAAFNLGNTNVAALIDKDREVDSKQMSLQIGMGYKF